VGLRGEREKKKKREEFEGGKGGGEGEGGKKTSHPAPYCHQLLSPWEEEGGLRRERKERSSSGALWSPSVHDISLVMMKRERGL